MKLLLLLSTFLLTLSPTAFSQELPSTTETAPETKKDSNDAYIKYIRYEEHIYSRAKKTELGDQMELEVLFVKPLGKNTKVGVAIEIDPQESSLSSTSNTSSTSKLSLGAKHIYEDFTFQIDLDLDFQTSDKDQADTKETKGIELGMDSDSEGNYINYDFNESFALTFFPFNFDGEVGDEFNTWDVTRIYYVEGAPTTVITVPSSGTTSGSENIAVKTIPGLIFKWMPSENLKVAAGGGVQTYFYPSDPGYDVKTNSSSTRWQRREDFGARLDLTYTSDDNFRVQLEHVWHDSADETGSLLESGTSFTAMSKVHPFMLGLEVGMSVAGGKAYKLNSRSTWFDTSNLTNRVFSPYYSDDAGNKQDWMGQTDFAGVFKVGYLVSDTVMPYFYYMFQGEDYIYRELESAHTLRTFNKAKSHGGLHRIGGGAHILAGKLHVNPSLEWRQAKNPVFSDHSDIQQTVYSSGYRKTDFLLSVSVTYSLEYRGAWGWWENRGKHAKTIN